MSVPKKTPPSRGLHPDRQHSAGITGTAGRAPTPRAPHSPPPARWGCHTPTDTTGYTLLITTLHQKVFFPLRATEAFAAAAVSPVIFPHLRPPADPQPLKVCFKNTGSCFQKRIVSPVLTDIMGHVIKCWTAFQLLLKDLRKLMYPGP